MTDNSEISVLFVCLGNICRSPLAEGVFRSILDQEGLTDRFRVESAGTGGYHAGEPPDPRSVDVARRNGIALEGAARRVTREDLEAFDYVIAMDRSNLRNLEALGPADTGATVDLLRSWDPRSSDDDREVPDPYYGGPGGFDRVYEMVDRACRGLLDSIRETEAL